MERCINWPCQLSVGHKGPCSTHLDDEDATEQIGELSPLPPQCRCGSRMRRVKCQRCKDPAVREDCRSCFGNGYWFECLREESGRHD